MKLFAVYLPLFLLSCSGLQGVEIERYLEGIQAKSDRIGILVELLAEVDTRPNQVDTRFAHGKLGLRIGKTIVEKDIAYCYLEIVSDNQNTVFDGIVRFGRESADFPWKTQALLSKKQHRRKAYRPVKDLEDRFLAKDYVGMLMALGLAPAEHGADVKGHLLKQLILSGCKWLADALDEDRGGQIGFTEMKLDVYKPYVRMRHTFHEQKNHAMYLYERVSPDSGELEWKLTLKQELPSADPTAEIMLFDAMRHADGLLVCKRFVSKEEKGWPEYMVDFHKDLPKPLKPEKVLLKNGKTVPVADYLKIPQRRRVGVTDFVIMPMRTVNGNQEIIGKDSVVVAPDAFDNVVRTLFALSDKATEVGATASALIKNPSLAPLHRSALEWKTAVDTVEIAYWKRMMATEGLSGPAKVLMFEIGYGKIAKSGDAAAWREALKTEAAKAMKNAAVRYEVLWHCNRNSPDDMSHLLSAVLDEDGGQAEILKFDAALVQDAKLMDRFIAQFNGSAKDWKSGQLLMDATRKILWRSKAGRDKLMALVKTDPTNACAVALSLPREAESKPFCSQVLHQVLTSHGADPMYGIGLRLECLSRLCGLGERQSIKDSISLLTQISKMDGRKGKMMRMSAISEFSQVRQEGNFRTIEECIAWLKELDAKK